MMVAMTSASLSPASGRAMPDGNQRTIAFVRPDTCMALAAAQASKADPFTLGSLYARTLTGRLTRRLFLP
jgi:hypothetical protein